MDLKEAVEFLAKHGNLPWTMEGEDKIIVPLDTTILNNSASHAVNLSQQPSEMAAEALKVIKESHLRLVAEKVEPEKEDTKKESKEVKKPENKPLHEVKSH